MTDHSDLLESSLWFIIWNDDFGGGKFQDSGNNFRCHASHSGSGWEVGARYGFEDGRSFLPFATEEKALTFYANYLWSRWMRAARGERFSPADGLISPRFVMIVANETGPGWRSTNGDVICSGSETGRWTVASRTGFKDGSNEVQFEDRIKAFELMVNHLTDRRATTA